MRAIYAAIIILALLAASGAAYFGKKWADEQRAQPVAQVAPPAPPPPQIPARTEVLVAKTALPPGQPVSEAQLDWQVFNTGDPAPNMISLKFGGGDAQALALQERDLKKPAIGKYAKHAIASGVTLTNDDLFVPGQADFLPGMLHKGTRGMSIAVDPRTAVSGFILPGDHVDILLTRDAPGTPGVDRRASELIMEDVVVIALDQSLTKNPDNKGPSQVAHLMTVEVTPQQAQVLAVAGGLGELSMVLRFVGDSGRSMVSNGASVVGDVSVSPGTAERVGAGPVYGVRSALAQDTSGKKDAWEVQVYRGSASGQTASGN